MAASEMVGVSRQGYYQWLKYPVTRRDWDDAHAINALREIHEDDPTLGYRFMTDELEDIGIAASENRVWRLCSGEGLLLRGAFDEGAVAANEVVTLSIHNPRDLARVEDELNRRPRITLNDQAPADLFGALLISQNHPSLR